MEKDMRRPFVVGAALLLLLDLSVTAFADEPAWLTDHKAALSAAGKDSKGVLALFTRSDSSGECKKLKIEIFESKEFKELRTQLLKEAAGFYGDLEKLLEGQTDAKSRRLLAEGYFQLGALTGKIGSRPEALAVHRKALAIRRELAAGAGADVEARLDVGRSLGAVGLLLYVTGDMEGALRAFAEEHDVGAQGDAVR